MPTPRLLPIAGLVCALLMAAAHLHAQPTVMWTASEATAVMSGPGESYYPVLKLPPGTQLEVHQQLPGGWLAVRPPQGSFSLVSVSAIESADYRTARVTRDGAASRVGSALVEDSSAVHVRLQRGELVEVLDPAADPLTHLVRIAPPAGEFRWVRAADVSSRPVAVTSPPSAQAHTSPVVVAEVEPQSPPEPAADSQAEVALAPPAPQQEATPEIATTNGNNQWRVREETDEATPASEPAEAGGGVEMAAYDSVESTAAAPATTTTEATSTAAIADNSSLGNSPQSGGAAPRSFESQLDLLEIQLSRRIAGPTNLWVFEDLEQQAAHLAGQATQGQQQNRIRELGTRMARFSEIANRHRALAAQQATAGVRSLPPVSAVPGTPAPANGAAGYDAVGVLRPVVSQRPGAPPYALVDDKGEVITFVTPGPSVNLQAHLGQRVAVSGTRAYLPAYRRRNIQTARVEPLEETRTR